MKIDKQNNSPQKKQNKKTKNKKKKNAGLNLFLVKQLRFSNHSWFLKNHLTNK